MDTDKGLLIFEDRVMQHGYMIMPVAVLTHNKLSIEAKMLYCILLDYSWRSKKEVKYTELSQIMTTEEDKIDKYLKELQINDMLTINENGITVNDPVNALRGDH